LGYFGEILVIFWDIFGNQHDFGDILGPIDLGSSLSCRDLHEEKSHPPQFLEGK